MGFDLEAEKVRDFREKYIGSQPPIEKLAQTAEYVQKDLIEGNSALIGGLTTVEGIQSTSTRRPVSASVDLIMENADISELGEEYPSWSHQSAYFADVEDIEVGVLDIQEFEPYSFPGSILDNGYRESIRDFEVTVAEPEGNISSKFNRINPEKTVKSSDAVDMNSHLHWYSREKNRLNPLAETIKDTVTRPYSPRIEEMRNSQQSFNEEETETLETATDTLEGLLEAK